jgi:hypothetical protein
MRLTGYWRKKTYKSVVRDLEGERRTWGQRSVKTDVENMQTMTSPQRKRGWLGEPRREKIFLKRSITAITFMSSLKKQNVVYFSNFNFY